MTDTAAARRPAPDPQGDWAATRGVLMSYTYLGSRPRAIDSIQCRECARLAFRYADTCRRCARVTACHRDARHRHRQRRVDEGPRRHPGRHQHRRLRLDIRGAHLAGRITTEMRSQLFTEARITDAQDPARHIGFGTANWAVLGRVPHRFCFPQPGTPEPGWAGLPPLWHAYSGRRRVDGTMEIPRLPLEVGEEYCTTGRCSS